MSRKALARGCGEVSRLARNSLDWQRMLQLCAYTDTLILDEEGIYDPFALVTAFSGCICCKIDCVAAFSTKARRVELALCRSA